MQSVILKGREGGEDAPELTPVNFDPATHRKSQCVEVVEIVHSRKFDRLHRLECSYQEQPRPKGTPNEPPDYRR